MDPVLGRAVYPQMLLPVSIIYYQPRRNRTSRGWPDWDIDPCTMRVGRVLARAEGRREMRCRSDEGNGCREYRLFVLDCTGERSVRWNGREMGYNLSRNQFNKVRGEVINLHYCQEQDP